MSKRLGIVGGGQLGGFLCRAARALGVQTTVLTSSPEGMVARYADAVIRASLDDLLAVRELVEQADVITFELEDVPESALRTLQEFVERGKVRVFPEPSTMLLLQNKGLQKDWLVENGFPTAPHMRCDHGLDPHQARERFGDQFVIKTQRGGYDGLGVELVKDGCAPAAYEKLPTVVEAAVEGFSEIAVLVARDESGHCVRYPVFQSSFDEGGNVLRRVVCPALVSDETAKEASDLACAIIDRLGGVGVFAVEYFLTDNELLVNEIAPRVHNVGHLTIEASSTSQFEQHVRAVMGMPLSPAVTVTPAVMDNLLYEPRIATAWRNEASMQDAQEVSVHWYGKRKPRPLRKMGHLTVVSESIEQARQLADRSLQQLRLQG